MYVTLELLELARQKLHICMKTLKDWIPDNPLSYL